MEDNYKLRAKESFEKKRTGLLMGIEKEHLTRLSKAGYVYMHQLVAAGKTRGERIALSERLDIPYDILYRVISCCDMAQLIGLSGKVLYYIYELGYTSLDEFKNTNPDKINTEALNYLSSIGKRATLPSCSRPGNWVEHAKLVDSLIEPD